MNRDGDNGDGIRTEKVLAVVEIKALKPFLLGGKVNNIQIVGDIFRVSNSIDIGLHRARAKQID